MTTADAVVAEAQILGTIDSILTVDPALTYDFEHFLINDLEIVLVKPEQQPVCKYFLKNLCRLQNCPYRHPPKGKSVVCKHWLRGLCKKGEMCEFLHEYNLKKMPECWFYTKLGECTNPECQYLHIDPNAKMGDCEWYARGFCKHGKDCRHKHTRLAVCQMYITGFCPKGENCEFGHPKYELPMGYDIQPNMEPNKTENNTRGGFRKPDQDHGYKSLDEITCFKCGEKGHYANHCSKRRKMDDAGM